MSSNIFNVTCGVRTSQDVGAFGFSASFFGEEDRFRDLLRLRLLSRDLLRDRLRSLDALRRLLSRERLREVRRRSRERLRERLLSRDRDLRLSRERLRRFLLSRDRLRSRERLLRAIIHIRNNEKYSINLVLGLTFTILGNFG